MQNFSKSADKMAEWCSTPPLPACMILHLQHNCLLASQSCNLLSTSTAPLSSTFYLLRAASMLSWSWRYCGFCRQNISGSSYGDWLLALNSFSQAACRWRCKPLNRHRYVLALYKSPCSFLATCAAVCDVRTCTPSTWLIVNKLVTGKAHSNSLVQQTIPTFWSKRQV